MKKIISNAVQTTATYNSELKNQAASKLRVAYKKPRYFVDLIFLKKNKVEVDFTINNGDCHTESIELSKLTQFAAGQQNDNNGTPEVQALKIVSYVLDNIYEVVEAYLAKFKLGQSTN